MGTEMRERDLKTGVRKTSRSLSSGREGRYVKEIVIDLGRHIICEHTS